MKFTYDDPTNDILGLLLIMGLECIAFFCFDGWLRYLMGIFFAIVGIKVIMSSLDEYGATVTINEDGICFKRRFRSTSIYWEDVARIDYDSDQKIRFAGKEDVITVDLKPFAEENVNFDAAMAYIREIQPEKLMEAMNFSLNAELSGAKGWSLIVAPIVLGGFYFNNDMLMVFAIAIGMLTGVYKVFRMLTNPRMREHFGDQLVIGVLAISLAMRPWNFFHLNVNASNVDIQFFLAAAFSFGRELVLAFAKHRVEEHMKEHGLVFLD